LNEGRKAKTLKRNDELVSPDEVLLAQPLPADVALIRREETASFGKRYGEFLSRLPAMTRNCLAFRRQGRSYAEIAALLHVTEDAARSRVAEAKRKIVAEFGALPPDVDRGVIAEEDGHDHE
jgi:DNA-directed RNA polymerase specialized sigma24 family protein